MTETERNPHEGQPFTDDDAAIATALEDASVPALLCSLVHMTGDPAWIRGPRRPRMALTTLLQSGMPDDELAAVRAEALPVIAAYRDAGCRPQPLDDALRREMMAFLACGPVSERLCELFAFDLQFDGRRRGGDHVGATRSTPR